MDGARNATPDTLEFGFVGGLLPEVSVVFEAFFNLSDRRLQDMNLQLGQLLCQDFLVEARI